MEVVDRWIKEEKINTSWGDVAFQECYIHALRVTDSTIRHLAIVGGTIEEIDFSGSKVLDSYFQGVKWRTWNTRPPRVRVKGAVFENCTFIGINFSWILAKGATFLRCTFEECILWGALTGATLKDCTIKECEGKRLLSFEELWNFLSAKKWQIDYSPLLPGSHALVCEDGAGIGHLFILRHDRQVEYPCQKHSAVSFRCAVYEILSSRRNCFPGLRPRVPKNPIERFVYETEPLIFEPIAAFLASSARKIAGDDIVAAQEAISSRDAGLYFYVTASERWAATQLLALGNLQRSGKMLKVGLLVDDAGVAAAVELSLWDSNTYTPITAWGPMVALAEEGHVQEVAIVKDDDLDIGKLPNRIDWGWDDWMGGHEHYALVYSSGLHFCRNSLSGRTSYEVWFPASGEPGWFLKVKGVDVPPDLR